MPSFVPREASLAVHSDDRRIVGLVAAVTVMLPCGAKISLQEKPVIRREPESPRNVTGVFSTWKRRAPVDRDVAGQLHVQPEVTHKLDLWAGVGQDRWHLPGGVDGRSPRMRMTVCPSRSGVCLGLGELVAVAIEMDELPACDLPGAVRGMAIRELVAVAIEMDELPACDLPHPLPGSGRNALIAIATDSTK